MVCLLEKLWWFVCFFFCLYESGLISNKQETNEPPAVLLLMMCVSVCLCTEADAIVPNAVQPAADVIMPQLVDEDSDRIERAALIVERQLRLSASETPPHAPLGAAATAPPRAHAPEITTVRVLPAPGIGLAGRSRSLGLASDMSSPTKSIDPNQRGRRV